MKSLVALCLFLAIHAQAFTLEETWGESYQKMLITHCREEQAYHCQWLCGQPEQCQINESICPSCVGSDYYTREIFLRMGQRYSTAEQVPAEEVVRFLKEGNFITISHQSVFNIFTLYGDLQVRDSFQQLCQFSDKNPLVFFDKSPYGLGKIRYIQCHNDETLVTTFFKASETWDIDFQAPAN